ncbi:MAG: transporter substrate-binding domain-containing protein, partial [Enterocloster clostridioformis]|nr:transporter substrate-binding domain-containing protein [Enterocloster clostridioformis]
DLRGHTIGVTAGQAAQSTVENMAPDYDWEIVTYEDSNAGFQDCSLGRIDCYANTVTNIEKAERAQNLEFRMLDQKLFGNNAGWWFADTEEGAGLRDDINVVLKEMHEDGTVSEIITKWFYEDLSQLISDEWLTATH